MGRYWRYPRARISRIINLAISRWWFGFGGYLTNLQYLHQHCLSLILAFLLEVDITFHQIQYNSTNPKRKMLLWHRRLMLIHRKPYLCITGILFGWYWPIENPISVLLGYWWVVPLENLASVLRGYCLVDLDQWKPLYLCYTSARQMKPYPTILEALDMWILTYTAGRSSGSGWGAHKTNFIYVGSCEKITQGTTLRYSPKIFEIVPGWIYPLSCSHAQGWLFKLIFK